MNITGAVQGCLMPTAQCLFSRMVGILGESVRLLDLYHNYPTVVETVLELFVECGRRMLCYLTPVSISQPFGSFVIVVNDDINGLFVLNMYTFSFYIMNL